MQRKSIFHLQNRKQNLDCFAQKSKKNSSKNRKIGKVDKNRGIFFRKKVDFLHRKSILTPKSIFFYFRLYSLYSLYTARGLRKNPGCWKNMRKKRDFWRSSVFFKVLWNRCSGVSDLKFEFSTKDLVKEKPYNALVGQRGYFWPFLNLFTSLPWSGWRHTGPFSTKKGPKRDEKKDEK